MKTNNLYRDIFIGLFLFAGLFSFMSGQFVISTLLFGFASLTSNLELNAPVRA